MHCHVCHPPILTDLFDNPDGERWPNNMAEIIRAKRLGCVIRCGISPDEERELNRNKRFWYANNFQVIQKLSQALKRRNSDVANFLYKMTLRSFSKTLHTSKNTGISCSIPFSDTGICDCYWGIFDVNGNLRSPMKPDCLKQLLNVMKILLKRGDDDADDNRSKHLGIFDVIGGHPKTKSVDGYSSKANCYGACDPIGRSKRCPKNFYSKDGQFRSMNMDEILKLNASGELDAGFGGDSAESDDMMEGFADSEFVDDTTGFGPDGRGGVDGADGAFSELDRGDGTDGGNRMRSSQDGGEADGAGGPGGKGGGAGADGAGGSGGKGGGAGAGGTGRFGAPGKAGAAGEGGGPGAGGKAGAGGGPGGKGVGFDESGGPDGAGGPGGAGGAGAGTGFGGPDKFGGKGGIGFEGDAKRKRASDNKARNDAIKNIGNLYSDVVQGKKSAKDAKKKPVKKKVFRMKGDFYGAAIPVLTHEPFDSSKPWTWIRRHPRQDRINEVGEIGKGQIKRYRRETIESKLAAVRQKRPITSVFDVPMTGSMIYYSKFGETKGQPGNAPPPSEKKGKKMAKE